MAANAWEVAGTEPDAPPANDPWTVAAVEPDSTALARGADADDHASPVARTESRMGDALHTARRFLMGSTPEEEATGDYKVGVIPSVKESLGEKFKLPSLSDVGTTLKTTAARAIGGSKLQSLEELKQAHLNDAKLPAERRALWADPDFIKLNEAIDQEKATLGEVSKDEQGVSERNQGFWQQAALNAAGSLEMSAPSLAAGVLTRNPELAVASMYSPTAATSYSQRRQAGVAPELAAKSAAIDGVLEVGTELLPAHALFKQGTGPFKRMVNFLSHELPGESAAQIGQNLNQYLTELPGEATAKDVVDNLWMSVKQLPQVAASVALAGGAQVAVANLAEGKHAPSVDEQGRQAEEFARRAAPDLGTPAPQLEAPKTPADFEITPEGTAKRPGEEVPERKALPAPQGSGAFVAGEQGTRELTQADERARQQAREERASLGSDNVTRVPLEALQAIQDGTATKEQVSQARAEGLVSADGSLLPVGRRQIQTLKRAKLKSSVTAETDPNAITVVPGEQGLHGVAIGGKPQAWYSSKKIATEEAQALRTALPEVQAAAPAVAPKTATVLGQEIEAPATPTAAQAEAGNYKKPVVYWHDMPIKIENVKGSTRTGPLDESGKPAWAHEMAAHYGYIQGSTATDKEGVDVYIGDHKDANKAFVIDQLTPDGKQFDEPKVVIGVKDATAASKLYLDHYPRGWKGLGAITEMNPEKLGEWAYSAAAKHPIAWQKPAEAAVSRYQEHATSLKNMAANAGWQEIGGKVITDEDAVKPGVTGRTKWVAKDQQWREAQTVAPLPKNSNGAATKAAVAKAIASEKLSAGEKRHVDALLDAEQNRHTEEQRFADLNKVSLADIDARIEQLKDLDAILSRAETHESDAEEPLFQRKKPGGQPDLFGDPVAVRNELKRLEAEKDRRRNSGQESVETGKEDDLFSKAKDQKPLFQRSDDDYRGQHTAPDREGGAPLHDVTKNGNYPEDIYSGDGARLYAHYGDSRDYEAIHAIQRVRNRPNRMVKVYRAVPHEQTSAERITQLEKQLARYQRRRIVPNGGRSGFENETAWYEGASKELEELKAQPPQSPARVKINPGDWVTTSRAYAKEHGEDHLGGKYKIISKTVMAKEVFTDANSIFEFGYYPASEAAGGEDQPLFQRNGRTVEVDGTRRPITDSTGKLLAQTTEQQRNFWRWFGNSKVVDEHGKPLVIYHGTGKKFTKFSKAKSTQGIFWVTSDRAAIESGKVGAQARGQILDLYASIKNPAGWDEYHKYGLGELKREGYDGAVLPDKDGTITAFVFESSQLKSATANRGTFDPNNPDITFRKGDKPAKGQPAAEVKAAVDTILARFKVQPELHVVENFNELPAPMLKVLAGQNVKDGDITAFYFKGGVYVIADQIKSMSDIPNTIAHEYVAHFGLRSALPREEYVPILEGIAKDMPMEVRRRGHVEFGKDFDLKNDFHRQRAAEETLAYYAGEYMSGNSIPERIKRWVQKFIGLLRDWTREVLGMPKLHDETFLKQLLVDLETHLKSGEGHAQAATEEPAFTSKQPTFYSALTRAAETAKREKGTGKEWLATLKNMPGIKQEEIEATDLEQFLGDRVKISKQEVVDYLNHNGVQVTEKILGDNPIVEFREYVAPNGDSTYSAYVDNTEQRHPFIRHQSSNDSWWVQSEGGTKTKAPDYASAHAIAMDQLHNTMKPATRYSQYVQPGGQSYKELLLTLPSAKDSLIRPMADASRAWRDAVESGAPNADELGRIYKTLSARHENARADYRHEHWAESNVLAHIRFDTREVQLESAKENNLGEKFLELASGVTPINGTLKIVNRGVQGMRQHAQISKAIVEAVPVDVVNSLRALKLSPEKLFSNNSVSAAFAAMPVNVRDRVINGIAAATMKTEALIRAKVLRSLSTGLDAELLPAMRTSDLDAGYVSSLLSSDETGESAILQGLESNDSGARSAASSATSIGTGSDERSAANLANLLNAHADIVRSSLVNANRHDKRTIRVMHIAEIQSDLHQAGRKIGYVTSSSGPYGATRDGRDGKWYVKNFETGKIEGLGLQTEELANASAVSRYNVDRLPNFPFKTTWVDLAVKRAIRFASENGFDRISWDSGATNAERYDLSKQVDGVRVMEATAADSVHLFIQTKGNTQWTRIAGNSVVKRDGLADAIGKELAEKALKKVDAGEIAEFHGLDLKVGGEGQKGFYDRIVPTATKRLVKKYGAQLSESRLNDADAVTEEDRRTRPIATAVAAGELPILGFDITDAMRSAAMEGQPLFQRNAQVDTQEFKRWFGNSKVVDAKGKPLVVYHGTNKNINEFLTDRELRHGDLDGIGAWFAENTELADAVIDFKRSNQSILGGGRKKTSKGSIIYPAYVSIKNPFVVGNIEALKHTIATAMIGENPDQFSPFEVQQKYIRTLGDAVRSLNNKSAKYFLEKHGYDGILIKDDKGYGSSWVAFHPNQVKSAIGNSGAFDPTNADIRFQRTSQTMPLRDEPNKPEWKVSGYQALATKAIDAFDNKLGWYYGPLGKLPEQNAYLKGRYLALGDIGAIRKVARHIFDALKGASTEDAAAVYDFMTTRDAAPDNIVDQKIMATAVQAKQLIAEQGQRLYDAGLLSDEAMERYAGEYLPRMYLKHVLGDQMFSEMGYGKKISSQGNLKMRKDIPIETRKFILGEITDPAFLASFSVSRVGRDLAMMDFLDFVSHNQAWVPPQMMVEWNGKKVSPYWVTSEAARLRRQANFIKDHPSAGKMREIADRMDALADRAKGKLDAGVELTDFKQIPDTARYGMLRGLWIRKEIYEDLVGAQTFIEPKSFEGMVQRTSGKIMRAFKFSKVSANLPSHFRNMMGNAIMLHLSGVPFQRVYSGEIFLKAISSILHKDEYYQIAQKHGMSESSFNNNELASIRDEWLAMQESESLGNGPAKIKAMFGRVTNAIGDIYQFEEELGKLAKLRDAMERQGMPEDDAMIEAHKWTFDYSLIPRWLKFIRNTPLGAPFFTYSYKAFPRMGEALVRRPWAYLPYLAAPYLMAELMKYLWGADDDDLKKARQAAPTWMQSQGGMQLLPWKDESGRLQMLNLGYITPWGMLADMGAQAGNNDLGGAVASTGLLSGPVPNVIAAVKTGIDPFTKKPIVPKGASPREGMEAITQYAWDMAMPGMFGSRGWYAKMRQLQKGEVNKYTGDLLLTKGQVWSQLFGLTVYPYDPEQSRELNMVFMQREIEDIQRNTKTKLRDQNLVNDEAKADQIREDAQERIRQKQEELQLYQQQSEVPKAFERDAKPKHQFLDLIGRVAPITDQKSKREAVRTILEAGHPALASLVEDLPVRLRPMVAAALREGRVNA